MLWEGNVFTGVCLSTGEAVGISGTTSNPVGGWWLGYSKVLTYSAVGRRVVPVADPRGRPRTKNFISSTFWENLANFMLAPPPMGNPGSAPGYASYSAIHKASGFTVHGCSTGLPGIIPVEQKSVHWLSMGAASRNDLLRSFCTAAL